jgi:hypothetical protein
LDGVPLALFVGDGDGAWAFGHADSLPILVGHLTAFERLGELIRAEGSKVR